MKVAIPIWTDHVSPVFDVARRVRLLQVDGSEIVWQRDEEMPVTDPAGAVVNLGVDVLICGAVSRALEDNLRACGCDVVHEICGSVDEVARAFLDGRLDNGRFSMPGCSNRKPLEG